MKLTENQLITVLLLIETSTVSEPDLKLAWELHDLIQKHRSETTMNSPTCEKCGCVAGCRDNPALCPNVEKPTLAAPVPSAALGSLAERRIFDAIRVAYSMGYSDARNSRSVPGDSAPGYKGREIEVDHGGALLRSLNQAIAQPLQTQKRFQTKLRDELDEHVFWYQLLDFQKDIVIAAASGAFANTQPKETK